MKAFTKKETGETQYTIRIEAEVKGFNAEKIVLMMRDVEYRKQTLNPPKEMKIIEHNSKNSDVAYFEIDLPFPLTNREFVQKRLFMGNKEDPENIRKLGLYDLNHEYHAVIIQSIEREEYPIKSKPIRGETKMYYLLLEEDVNDKSVLKMRLVLCQDLKGDIPKMILNSMITKMSTKFVGDILKSYTKIFN